MSGMTPQHPAAPETETDANGIAGRLIERQREWLWHEGDDEHTPGHGHHMSQMLYRLPRDSQTFDMKASIESTLADMSTLLADLDAARERVRVVEGEREAIREERNRHIADADRYRRLYRSKSETSQMWWRKKKEATARAESAEAAHEAEKAAHERLRAGVEALADEWAEDYPGPNAACNRTPDEWATGLRSLLGGGEAR